MSAELKPCPFCGTQAVMSKGNPEGYFPECDTEQGGCGVTIGWFSDEHMAAKTWNRRATVELSDEEIDRLMLDHEILTNYPPQRRVRQFARAIIAAHRSATNKENLLVQECQE